MGGMKISLEQMIGALNEANNLIKRANALEGNLLNLERQKEAMTAEIANFHAQYLKEKQATEQQTAMLHQQIQQLEASHDRRAQQLNAEHEAEMTALKQSLTHAKKAADQERTSLNLQIENLTKLRQQASDQLDMFRHEIAEAKARAKLVVDL